MKGETTTITGYIFYNKRIEKLCIQEEGKEPDELIYLHTIKSMESLEVYRKGQWEKL